MSPPGMEVGHGGIGSISLPLLKSLPQACPAQHPDWEVPETGAREGTVCDSCCWGTSGAWNGSSWGEAGPHASSLRLYWSTCSCWFCRSLR